jgi:hypothetical protein
LKILPFILKLYINISNLCYQLDLVTPGISVFEANSLKQMRQMPKSLIKPWLRPQRQHRLTILVENFGFLLALTIKAVLAIYN